ncbi:succinate dehydrogenase assembly factor 2 [Roseicyclus sp. F158]|uniref:FAD assembly factor SdhE n=1 Tax=Tropicimonas omnivorans TaxID=3075590 RepID=A0ABU3DG06_9RHOB|nr:succinate dehydrogenase assembly factor 2 [Roseicyclus sp. F158]MDT0682645.1 succinate dehydrogenase assembly factor 2 [Roseicyclus sp. F158]
METSAKAGRTEDRETRERRLTMRSGRRGMKEMDLILGPFARTTIDTLGEEELDRYEALLSENDQDLYRWVSGQAAPPEEHAPMIRRIAEQAGV